MTERISMAEYRQRLNAKVAKRRTKYGSRKVIEGDKVFDSMREYERWKELKILAAGGIIGELRHHVEFPCMVNGIEVCIYEADFVYVENARVVVEDVKSEPTRKDKTYRLKRKLFEACYGAEIKEVG
jgi:hypothetical protein